MKDTDLLLISIKSICTWFLFLIANIKANRYFKSSLKTLYFVYQKVIQIPIISISYEMLSNTIYKSFTWNIICRLIESKRRKIYRSERKGVLIFQNRCTDYEIIAKKVKILNTKRCDHGAVQTFYSWFIRINISISWYKRFDVYVFSRYLYDNAAHNWKKCSIYVGLCDRMILESISLWPG